MNILPVIAIVGQPNVGKSTLFNRLTKSRDAIVVDMPGVTRDRQYGQGKLGEKPYIVIDTGGIGGDEQGIDAEMVNQSELAIAEADIIIFLVDGRHGLSAADQAIAQNLRQTEKPVFLVVNKTDGIDEHVAMADFYSLGLGNPTPIAASHGRGVTSLIDVICEMLPDVDEDANEQTAKGITMALIGRPNVGKSTLTNRILGDERVIVFDQPGTTRDSIFLPFERHGKAYTIVDTAGVRRRGKVRETVEKFSVIKTLQAIEAANVVIPVLDASETVSEQDLHLIGFALDAGKAIVVAINKWDGLDTDQRDHIKSELDRRLNFLSFANVHFISALHGTGVGDLFGSVEAAYASATKEMSTPLLTNILQQALIDAPPPLANGRRIKLRYAHPGGHNPPTVVIHGNLTKKIPGHYKRYLSNYFRKALKLTGTPLKLVFKTGDNPYA
tara:strand:+ start:23459 stop:24784 length:1326 start_codon:yes stop_codon:yes gene_type:complete